ncbi:hypothetical protein [Nigerium massiliense]|uniref:hypothetical protein n=1 Tax=Nigerium massiliense TaxID=1522317 RepID=UPI00058C7B5A|nr:hypothetical protein [Nigerium massiliense]
MATPPTTDLPPHRRGFFGVPWRPAWQPPPGVATTGRIAPVVGVLAAVVATILAFCVPAGVRADDRAAGISLFVFTLAPLAAACFTWQRDRSFRRRDALVAAVAGLATLAAGPLAATGTALGVLASLALLRARLVPFPWVRWLQPRSASSGVRRALLTAALTPLVLWLLAGMPHTFSLGADEVFVALAGAVNQEAGWRLFWYAVAIYAIGGVPRTRAQRGWCLALLVVPHVLMFTLSRVAAGAWTGLLLEGGLVALVYVIPLALVFRRHGLVPAVLAHALIDAVRSAALV